MLTGVILAGGRSRNLKGAPKALLPFSGEKLIERQIREMRTICREIILVTSEPRLYLPILGGSIRIITDFYAGKEPLSGMHAALALSTHTDLWIAGGDMPFISAKAAELLHKRKQVLEAEAVLPSMESRLEPLHGIYDKRCTGPAACLLEKGEHRVAELLKRVRWEQVDQSLLHPADGNGRDFTMHVRNQDEYAAALRLAEQPVS